MKRLFIFSCFFTIILLACNKESVSSNPNLLVISSTDTVRFDTVFTSIGSVTQSIKIFNINKQNINFSDIKLFGGNASAFKINVNGQAGTDFSNIELAGGDSMYIFITVNINPNNAQNPFLMSDSIGYSFNGNTNIVQLQAYGQNAVFLNATTINTDTTWTNKLPIVALGNITVASNATLTIEKGTRIFSHSKAGFQINGTLKANGGSDSSERIVFTGDRIDYPYNYLPGSWSGINLGEDSKNNQLNFTSIKNASVGIADTSNLSGIVSRLSLNGCILENNLNESLLFNNSSVTANNCLIINSDTQVSIENGGNYDFEYCTIAGYSNDYVSHFNPSLSISNTDENSHNSALDAGFTNCIIYGDNLSLDEISVSKTGSLPFNLNFTNSLYKANNSFGDATFTDCLQNQDPMFVDTDARNMNYNFQLINGSPAIGTAKPTSVLEDLLGNAHDLVHPTMGCYEFKD